MDQVVQQNAANAEESAAASEALSAHASHMKDLISNLVDRVAGSAQGSGKMTG
jgi:methyl-accepting chemotaxis protein